MKQYRSTSIIVGLLILVAYSVLGTNNPEEKALGMFLEVISGIAVLGIASLMFPLLKLYGQQLSVWYLGLKGLEGILMIIAGLFYFVHTPFLLELREQIYLVHGYIFAVPALFFYYLLYQSQLIPRWLSIWGVIAAIILVIVNLLELFGGIPQLEVLYLPIVLNELVLAIWLMTKGFNSSSITK